MGAVGGSDVRLDADAIVQLAFDATSSDELRQEILRRLVAATGSIGGVLADQAVPVTSSAVHGFPAAEVERARMHWLAAPDVCGLGPMFDALARQRVVIDRHVYEPRAYERLPVREVMAPLGVHSALASLFSVGTGRVTLLTLAHDTSRSFDARDTAYVGSLVPALALAMAAHPALAADDELALPGWLTERQQEICLYVVHGYSNPEVAEACGISLHTVRNHLVRLFEMFDVSTRTELASRLLRLSEAARVTPSPEPGRVRMAGAGLRRAFDRRVSAKSS